MLYFDDDVGSIAFGLPGSELDGLLFVSHTDAAKGATGSTLSMVDLATLRIVDIATGGTRGYIVATSANGRIFVSQSHRGRRVGHRAGAPCRGTNPPSGASIGLPMSSLTVTFDADMLSDDDVDPNSVLNPANYRLVGSSAGRITISSVIYDAANRTATLNFNPLFGDKYELDVLGSVENSQRLKLTDVYTTHFKAVADLTTVLDVVFTNVRSDRKTNTISYDVNITNTSAHELLLPLVLRLTPLSGFKGVPDGVDGRAADGSWLIDLTDNLPANHMLAPGASVIGQTITVYSIDHTPVTFDPTLTGLFLANTPPKILSQPVLTAAVGANYSYSASGYDPEGGKLSWVLAKAPKGMTIDAQTGVISWSPGADSPMTANIVLQLYDDGGAFNSQTFAVAVSGTDQAPVFATLPAITGTEGAPLKVNVQATDPEGDLLTYWADSLPAGASFDAADHALVWTPGSNAAGTYTGVQFYVSDGIRTVSETTTITISPTPQPPVFTPIADTSAQEGETIRIALSATDPKGLPLSYTSTALPPGATLDPLTGVFVWNTDYTQHGLYQITFTADNGVANSSQTAVIQLLNVNAAPVFADQGQFQVDEGQLLSFSASALDPNNPTYVAPSRAADGSLVQNDDVKRTVTYQVEGLPSGATFDTDTLIFNWTPGFKQAGVHTFTIVATNDGDGTGVDAKTSQTVTINVVNVNRPPAVVAIPDQTLSAGKGLTLPIQATDPDGDPLALSVVGLPDFGSFVTDGSGKGHFVFNPTADDRGNYTMTVSVADDGDGNGAAASLSASRSFVLSVDAPNAPPHFTFIGDKVLVVGKKAQFTISATDADQDPLSFTLDGLPAGATLSNGPGFGQATVAWTPTANDIGSYSIVAHVADDGNGDPSQVLTDRQNFELTVRTSDAAPVFPNIGDLTIPQEQTLVADVAAVDPDKDPLTYSASGMPPGAAIDAATGQLSWNVGKAPAGTYDGIIVTATDGALTATTSVRIIVTPINHAPKFTPLGAQSGREGAALQFTLIAEDPDSNPLTYAVTSGLPDGAVFDTTSGRLQWTPNYDQAGAYTIGFTVTDSLGLTDATSVSIHIDNTDRAPSFDIANHAAVIGKPVVIAPTGSDPDSGTKLTWSATGLPDGAALDAATGRLTWVPGPTQVGDFSIAVSLSDGELAVTHTSVIRVTPEVVPPSVLIELTPSFPGLPELPVVIHAAATSFASIASLTMTVDGQSVTLDDHGRATFTPTTPGRYQVIATATDADGAIGTATIALKVRDPDDVDAPVVAFEGLGQPRRRRQPSTSRAASSISTSTSGSCSAPISAATRS